jgi:plastocyanin
LGSAVKRIVPGAAGAAAALGLASVALAGGAPTQIGFTDDPAEFDPATASATVDPDVVTAGGAEFAWLGPGTVDEHNVRQDDKLFRSGPPSEDFHEYQTDISAGRYHYYCDLHGSQAGGMAGTVRVRPAIEGAFVRWADAAAEEKHRFTVEFRRKGGRKWATWKRATKAPRLEFGAGNKPVRVKPGRDYQVRVRTFVANKPKRRSGWSPVVTFEPGAA